MTLDDALCTFITESGELLDEMETRLLAIDGQQPDAETVNAIFRAAHTIKGSAGLFGIDQVVAFTHVAESVLDSVRAGQFALDGELVALLLSCRDHIGVLMAGVQLHGIGGDPALDGAGDPLRARLQAYLGQPAAAPATAPAAPQAAGPGRQDANWQISLLFGPEVFRNGMDPLSFLRYLDTIGSIVSLTTLDQAVPGLDQIDPEACYLGFEIAFSSTATAEQIEAVFEFVRDDCRVRVVPVPEPEPEPVSVPVPVPVPAAAPPAPARDGKAQDGGSIRVDAEKLDRLINLVGELIITTASANLIARRSGNLAFQECGATLSSLVEEVRDSALQLRMVKIGATFNRFRRVVHDVSHELGKEIGLVVSGEDTELDKTVVEKIGDPLTHLVRNAIDHGIETAELRAARGKPAAGTIGLNAYHDSGTIVIEVSDDGGGLKRDRILAKAIDRGLVEPGKSLADEEIDNLIFEPGFSTAEQLTNLSGRGVGMDVVKRNITALRGTVSLRSVEGQGTTVTVRLPLTLAIINGFQVSIGKSVFVIPLDMVEECVDFVAEPGHDYANLRGQVLPFLCLRTKFGIAGTPGARRSNVVVKYAGVRAGLVVDTLLGESQTVIKPLGKAFQQLQGISGASILGSGDVALILDVPALIRQANAAASAPLGTH